MTEPRQYEADAVVLAHVVVGEKDKIVTLFAREQGKLRAVARGAVRPGSSLGPCVEPLTHARLYCVRRRSIDLIAQAVPQESFGSLKADLWRMSCGLYMAELIDLTTAEGVPHRALFDLVLAVLRRFDSGEKSEALLRYFELRLLDEVGFRPSLQRCVDCGASLRPVENALSAALGGVVCPDCAARTPDARPLSVDALKVLRLWLDSPLDVAVRVRVGSALSAELDAHIYRLVLGVVQREVRSRGWLLRLKQGNVLTSGG
jgi:DNA repair protein RecO (recombination protein O)